MVRNIQVAKRGGFAPWDRDIDLVIPFAKISNDFEMTALARRFEDLDEPIVEPLLDINSRLSQQVDPLLEEPYKE